MPASERRRYARIKQSSLNSSLGPVVDLSRGGLRVISTRRLRGSVDIVLFNRSGPHLELKALVIWSQRIGFRKHLTGLEFVDPPPDVTRQLTKIGTTD